jgi:hypothetical protein
VTPFDFASVPSSRVMPPPGMSAPVVAPEYRFAPGGYR